MKKQTTANLVAVLAVLIAGPETVETVASKTGLSTHQVNALEGIWSNKAEGTKPLFTRKGTGGHTFLIVTEEGRAFKAPEVGSQTKAIKPPAMTEEAARAALLASIEAEGSEVAEGSEAGAKAGAEA